MRLAKGWAVADGFCLGGRRVTSGFERPGWGGWVNHGITLELIY